MQLRVLTLNVWFLPLGISRDDPIRLQAIGQRLAELDADVVALQEVWTEEARTSLLAAGKQAGYHHIWHNPEARGGSGLVVISRLPIIDSKFESFLVRGKPERLDHSDYYGGKGFALIRVRAASGPISILNTHLHARYADSAEQDQYLETRTAQVVQICAAVQAVDEPLIAMGDFNLQEGESEYKILRGLTGWKDTGAELDVRQPTAGRANPYASGPSCRIDYVFTRDGADHGARGISTRRVFDEPPDVEGSPAAYSDHFGVLAEVEVAEQPGSRHAPDAPALALARDIIERGQQLTIERERGQRIGALGGVVAAAAIWTAAPRYTRREWLRTLARLGAVASATASAGLGWLALSTTPEELNAYRTVEQWLKALEQPLPR